MSYSCFFFFDELLKYIYNCSLLIITWHSLNYLCRWILLLKVLLQSEFENYRRYTILIRSHSETSILLQPNETFKIPNKNTIHRPTICFFCGMSCNRANLTTPITWSRYSSVLFLCLQLHCLFFFESTSLLTIQYTRHILWPFYDYIVCYLWLF